MYKTIMFQYFLCCITHIDYSNIRYWLRDETLYISIARKSSTRILTAMWFYKDVTERVIKVSTY